MKETRSNQSNLQIAAMLMKAEQLTVIKDQSVRDGIQGELAGHTVRFFRRVSGWNFNIDVYVSIDGSWRPVFVNMPVEETHLQMAWDSATRIANNNDYAADERRDEKAKNVIKELCESASAKAWLDYLSK